MIRRTTGVLLVTLSLYFIYGYTQDSETTLTIEERIERLESMTASLETRLTARTSFGGAASLASSDRGLEVTTRLDALERRFDAFEAELKRLERRADAAVRQADTAQREAVRATSLARDAARRP